MTVVSDYVARIEGTCGKEQDVIVSFKFDKKEEAMKKILGKAVLRKSISGVIFELSFKRYSFRMYCSGKVIFRNLSNREELNALMADLLS